MADATKGPNDTNEIIGDELARGDAMSSDVAAALAAIKAEGTFAAELGLSSKDLSVEVHGVGPLRFPISAATAKKLCAGAHLAPFGRGDRTVHDRSVRDTWEIGGDRITIDARRWRPALVPVLATLRERLGLPEGVLLEASLDKMLVYGPGQFFAPHQDSERSDDMVGTLVVELPSRHEGGEFVVQHDGEKKIFGRAAQGPKELSLIAFYADCHHEVKPVRSGFRIILTYHLLRRGTAKARARLRLAAVERLAASVEAHFSTPVAARYSRAPPQRPDRLIYLLDHEYTEKSLSWDQLKNADRLRVEALRAVAERLDCEAYLALADVHEIWSCEDVWLEYGWRRRRRRAFEEDDDLDVGEYQLTDLIDDGVELRHWIGLDGQTRPGSGSTPRPEELCFTRASVDMNPFKSEHEGYMGNYGNTVDRWYHRAALVIWPRSRNFVIRAKMCPSWALREIASLIEAGSTDAARGRVHDLLPFWDQIAPSESSAAFTQDLLEVLASLDDVELALGLLSPLGPHRLSPEAMPAFAALVERHGLAWAKQLFSVWADATRYDTPIWLPSLPRLCQALSAGGERGRALAGWLLSREVGAFKQRRAGTRRSSGAIAEELANEHIDDLSALLEAAAAIQGASIRDDLIASLVAPGTALPIMTAGALLQRAREGRTPAMVRSLGLQRLHRHVVDSLEGALAARERDPNDWSIEPPTGCACALCSELAVFLRDRDRTEFVWPLAEHRRRHVHEVIDGDRLPVSHTTVRRGRPFALVLTKQAALFEREKAERARQETLLAWLKRQQDTFSAPSSPPKRPSPMSAR